MLIAEGCSPSFVKFLIIPIGPPIRTEEAVPIAHEIAIYFMRGFRQDRFAMRSQALFFRLILAALLVGAAGAQALTFNVNSPADVPDANPGDGKCETTPGGVCTLRAAIQESNAHPGADIIMLQSNTTYTLTRVGVDDTALNGDLDISDDTTIIGAGPNSTIIDGNGSVIGERVIQAGRCKPGGTDSMGHCINGYIV